MLISTPPIAKLTFGRAGNAAKLDCDGIDFTDTGEYSWTTAALAELEIKLPLAREDATIEIDTGAYCGDTVPQQHVFAYLGGAFIGFWRVRAYGVLSARVPRHLFTGKATRLAFAIPTATSPFALGLGQDRRELGLHLHSITFRLGQ